MSETTGREERPSVRQAARRAALDAQAKLRVERQERDKRLAALALDVLFALGERDAAVIKLEQRAGAALRQLFDDEHLTPAEVTQWCGPSLTRQEIARLRRLGGDQQRTDRNLARKRVGDPAPKSSSGLDRPDP
ncbi:hypothetical protein [Terrabacter carboxydivorans]|uniref:Uncharacterized protein n=1 Tax=Terrabacter carboxydivorans TaxID=619730 RepID=A0ABN3KPN7_9MICO